MEGIIKFYDGEDRIVSMKAVPQNRKETVVIRTAKYKLIDLETEEIVESGSLEINGEEMIAKLKWDKEGEYVLKITAKIGRETYIDKVRVRVM